jgi:transcriptional regulator
MAKVDLLQGTLDMLVLKALNRGPMHGYAVARWIQQISDDALQVEEGSLYPALYRMENRGWITSEEGLSENNRKARHYKLTRAGRKQLATESSNWDRLSEAIAKVMQTA